jgi:threonine/homoserine/homoserine lactone efflux protein
MSLIVSMAAFALVVHNPGAGEYRALSSGAQYGFRASQRHVAGATLGFVLLLVLMGLGLHEVLKLWPFLTRVVQLAGVAFLLFMA